MLAAVIHSRMLSNTLLPSLCGADTETVFVTTRSAGISVLVDFDGNEEIVEDDSEVLPSISSNTRQPFSVIRKSFKASCVKAACFRFLRNRSNAAIIAGS